MHNAYIVMPLAAKSLEDAIKSSDFDEVSAKEILAQIANGLTEIGNVVHRDLKPANVLFHEEVWKVADFGISKIVGQATATSTHKLALTPAYASPERWNEEAVTSATDVYSLGCMAHVLLNGETPFSGPDRADYKRQHCYEVPPDLLLKDTSLSVLIAGMLSKSPDARPSLETIGGLRSTGPKAEEPLPEFTILANAGLAVAKKSAVAEAEAIEEKAQASSRKTISADGYRLMHRIALETCDAFSKNTPNIEVEIGNESVATFEMTLGQATFIIEFEPSHVHPENEFSQSGWDVYASGMVSVLQKKPSFEWRASLWYTDCGNASSGLGWYECSYFTSAASSIGQFEPYALSLKPSKADLAASGSMGPVKIAFGPKLISEPSLREFQARWAKLFAKAVRGKLGRPPMFPIPPRFFQ